MLLALMVMPRSRSRSMESSTCDCISRWLSAPVSSSKRSASVDLPWSICAMMQKLRMYWGSMALCANARRWRERSSLCARASRLSTHRVCHTKTENRNWKAEMGSERGGLEPGVDDEEVKVNAVARGQRPPYVLAHSPPVSDCL